MEALLATLLGVKDMTILLFSLEGDVLLSRGKQIDVKTWSLTKAEKEAMRDRGAPKIKYWAPPSLGQKLISVSRLIHPQTGEGIVLKTVEDMSDIKAFPADIDDGDQLLGDLFQRYPSLRKDMGKLDESLSQWILDPSSHQLLKQSTIDMLAKSLRMDPVVLLDGIKRLVSAYE